MNFEPQKFFIGLVDFFSIFMPGALLTYLVKDWAAMKFLGTAGYALNGPEPVIVFFFASYLLGHAAFLLSAVLDEWIYDPIRALTDWGQIKRLAYGKELSPLWLRRLAASDLLFGREADDKTVMHAQRIKARALHHLAAEDAVNAFQWCKARLTKDLPEGLLAVQQFEAASKFFRSLFVVLATLALFYACHDKFLEAGLCFAGMLPSLWRYIDQRFKATQQAYWFVITLEAREAKALTGVSRDNRLSHAGGIVYRKQRTERMLVESSENRSERVLPKGHIEPGEDPRITAVREVKEETGQWARIRYFLEDSRLGRDTNAPYVRWFVLDSVEEPKERRCEERQGFWFSLEDAIDKATFDDTKALLRRVDERFGSSAAKHEIKS
jgi:8-oxo-dGTP pyrophosphatase MutT (NUDIX family)